ncbi:MAG TPA: alpha/beta fold hydrolase [Paracoccus sp. (in: a-proteobacteria)]|nr:alpha/beta fold hydrolase [Paracoccus sp. (in: a-proteobacteria)]
MMLNQIVSGAPSALPPVVLAHGLFGQARNLGGLARRLGADRQVVSVDMRNHGESFQSPDHSYEALAGDLAQVIEAQGGRADVVGHSMGGKAAMRLAMTRPELVRRLVVLDIAPVSYPHTQESLIEAMESLDLSGLTLRSQADAALAAKVQDPGVRAFLLQSLDLKAQPPAWKMNLAVLHERMDDVTGFPAGGRPFDGPALFLAGGDSDYVDPRGESAIRAAFPQAVIEHMPGIGHWLHAERPAEVGERVAGFLNGTG